MRVLHVGHGYRPFHHGGLVTYAEDLMREQVGRGHDVAYFCSGRHYPLVRPHVRRRTLGGVRLYELINSPAVIAPLERGTRKPRRDIEAVDVDRLFGNVLDEVRPDVVHVQELGGIPSSVLDVARERGIAVLMTLQDYFPLCPTVKLFDVDGQICLRRAPAPQCARCCRDAPGEIDPLFGTLSYHRRVAEARLPVLKRLPQPRDMLLRRRIARDQTPARARGESPTPPPDIAAEIPNYQLRRDVNVARLNRVDRLVAMSGRVAGVYAELGVDRARMETMQLTLAHIDGLRPRRLERVGAPLRLVTLAGCSTVAKGVTVVADALERLEATGFGPDDLVLGIAGQIDPAVADRVRASPLVRELGSYGASELDSLLDDFDVGVIPSVWEEAYGFVGVEFLAKGLPVIGNAIGGIPEHTRPGVTGWLNEDCSGEGLAAIIAAIVREPQQVVELNESVLRLRPELIKPMSAHAAELEELYRALARQTSSTSASVG